MQYVPEDASGEREIYLVVESNRFVVGCGRRHWGGSALPPRGHYLTLPYITLHYLEETGPNGCSLVIYASL